MTTTAIQLPVVTIQGDKKCLTTVYAAQYLGYAVDTLKKWRKKKIGPTFICFSRNRILYPITELDKYLATKHVHN